MFLIFSTCYQLKCMVLGWEKSNLGHHTASSQNTHMDLVLPFLVRQHFLQFLTFKSQLTPELFKSQCLPSLLHCAYLTVSSQANWVTDCRNDTWSWLCFSLTFPDALRWPTGIFSDICCHTSPVHGSTSHILLNRERRVLIWAFLKSELHIVIFSFQLTFLARYTFQHKGQSCSK